MTSLNDFQDKMNEMLYKSDKNQKLEEYQKLQIEHLKLKKEYNRMFYLK